MRTTALRLFSMLLLVCVAGCGGGKAEIAPTAAGQVSARYDRLDVKERSLENYRLAYTIVVANDGPTPITVAGGSYTFQFDETEAGGGAIDFTGTVPAGGQAEVPIDVVAPFPTATDEAVAYLDGGLHKFMLTGKVAASTGELPFEAGGELKVPVMPKALIEGGSMAKEGNDTWEFTFDAVVDNEANPFAPNLARLKFDLLIFGKAVMQLDQPYDTKLPPSGRAIYTFSTKVTKENIGAEKFKELDTVKKFSYKMQGTVKVDKFEVPIAVDGELNFSR